MKHLNYFLSACSFLFLLACENVQDYPVEPYIEYKSHTAAIAFDAFGNKVKSVEIVFVLKDGDGDIGLSQDEAGTPPYVGEYINNLFPKLFAKEDSVFVEVEEILVENYTIPFIEPRGQHPALKADIKVEFKYTLTSLDEGSDFPYDTIMYEIYMVDRALHKSNVLKTPEIIFLPNN